MKKSGFWLGVKSGSTLTITTKGKTSNDTQFVGGARHVPSEGSESIWDINPGPKVVKLEGTFDHVIRIGFRVPVDFDQEIVVTTTLKNPDGSIHKDFNKNNKFDLILSGKRSDGMLRGNLVLVSE